MTKTLYLMRHGQTLFNVRRKIQGWCDAPLTQLGIYQAQKAGEWFKEREISFDCAYSSTSERACDTLEIITDMDYSRKKGLKEWNFGTFEGESEDLNPALPYGEFFKAYNGESEEEVRQRVSACLKEIMEKDGHESVLAVSHGASCAQFYLEWEKYNQVNRDGRLQNCCILKYEYKDGIFRLVELWNEPIKEIGQ